MDLLERPSPSTVSDDGNEASSARGALAGMLGAAGALVTISLVSLADAAGPSVTLAVQNRFIDTFAASLKQTAIDLFGRNDKLALQIGTAVVVLLLGAAAGAIARDRWEILAGVFGAFAALGIWAAAVDPLASVSLAVVASILGAAFGTAIAVGLERRWRIPAGAHRGIASDLAIPERRDVLVSGGAAALALAIGAVVARGARSSLRAAKTTASRILPKPVRTVPVPASQPFEVKGLTPFITPVKDFYRIDTAPPEGIIVDPDGWEVAITGMVDKELSFSYDDLLARKLVEVPITMQCVSNEVGGDLIGTARFTGVPLGELLSEAGVNKGADQIVGEAVDGFTAGFPAKVALDGRDALLAVGMNGRSLTKEHGFPARLIIPGLYGYVSATKWLKEIRLTSFAAEQGFWVPRGWSRLGPIKTQSRIDVPRPGAQIAAGRQPIAGVAWAPHRGIAKVEVRFDEAGPWQAAELGRVASADTWVQWKLAWDASPGDRVIEVRATDDTGEVQTAERARPDPNGATGHDAIQVTVLR